jgi:mannosyltransferase
VAGTVVLGQRLAGRAAGLAAGAVLMILPAITEMGIEARSYPWSVAVVAWLTVVLVEALHDGRARWWLGYGLLASLMVALFLNNALVVVAHGLTVLLVRSGRRAILSFGLAAAGAAVLAAPVALLSFRQRGQVGWITEVGFHTVEQVVVQQWFRGGLVFAVLAWLVVAVVVVVGATRRRALRPLLVVALPWLLLPTSLLLAVSLVLQPLYTPRYLASGAPALALVVGAGIALIPWRVVRVAAVLGLAALTASTYVAQRQPLRFGTEWRETAAFLEEAYEPGDAILFNQRVFGPAQYTRGTMTLYRDRLSGFDDVELLESHRTSGLLRDTFVDPAVLVDRLADVDGAWVVWPASLEWDGYATKAALEESGFHLTETVSLEYTDLRYFERTP